jgi:hypothetical protein
MQQYPHTSLERDGMYGKFLHALYRTRDIAQASQQVDLLETQFPNSAQALTARAVLRKYSSGSSDAPPTEAGSVLKTQPSSPTVYNLHDNYPNPFNPSTTISYDLPTDSKVTLKVYDVLGREVATLVDEYKQAGYHEARLNASTMASGVYLYRLQSGSFTATKKFLLLR